ncbi:acyl transferase [Aspergillus nomiae NRRL 13137]|uniref:Acyl transferase n=1 Tax=Aspergillus nomiae NRRL (strain ATCC 15546 / NRRL 13137 / CBS 260.88 / M93) TaxID=1509407 RepID=A0A0L1IYR7_ASPN3|nr:acyl transferase [Aspergillus nomiae NRRL 13137]KNG84647.1 acyl transferase [Aspergillus nomiae NRRL 13137]
MTYGEKPEAHPDGSPVVAAYKANFVPPLRQRRHGLGWPAILNQTPFPTWDLACLDRSRITKQKVPEESKVDGPASPERHPDHTAAVSLLFHLPKSKATELKQLATPSDGSWISAYDAFSAFIWRTLSRLRAPVFKPDMSSNIFWAEKVSGL